MVALMTHISSLPNFSSGGVMFDSNGAEDYLHPQSSSSSELSGGEIAGASVVKRSCRPSQLVCRCLCLVVV